jgi:hypothetical protein
MAKAFAAAAGVFLRSPDADLFAGPAGGAKADVLAR